MEYFEDKLYKIEIDKNGDGDPVANIYAKGLDADNSEVLIPVANIGVFQDLYDFIKHLLKYKEVTDYLCKKCLENMYIKTGKTDLREMCYSSGCSYAKMTKEGKL